MTDTVTDRPKVIEFTSPDSTTVLYACTWCELLHPRNDRAMAERCCVCTRCGGRVEKIGWTACEPCRDAAHVEREAERRAKYLALPVVDDDGGMVYVEDQGRWYECLDAAREALVDDGIDLSTVIVFPGIKGVAHTPSIAQLVEEHWGEQFEDPYDCSLPREAVDALTAAEKMAIEHAPVMWEANTKVRVAL